MNKNQIRNEAFLILQQRRANAEANAKAVLLSARKDESFAKNEIAIRTTELEIAKADGATKKSELKEKLKNLKAERGKILSALGLVEKSLQPQYHCNICNDTGMANGKDCKCIKNIILYKMLKESGVEPKELADFSDFKTDIASSAAQNKQLAAYKKLLLDLSEKMPNQKTKTITICGTPGNGKTFGARCLIKDVLKRGETALFVTAFEMNSLFLKYHTAFVQDKNAIFDTLLDPELLVIDDIGTEPMLKNVTKEYLLLLLNERLSKEKSTIIIPMKAPIK